MLEEISLLERKGEKMELVIYPDNKLNKVCEPIDFWKDNEDNILENKLFELLYRYGGIGLAAPQIGILKRAFVMDLMEENGSIITRAVFNPEILEKSDEMVETEEGCLSLPGIKIPIKRSKRIKVKYFDGVGKEIIEEFDGLASICAQHEIDHLGGKILLDYISPLRRNLAAGKIKKIKKGLLKLENEAREYNRL